RRHTRVRSGMRRTGAAMMNHHGHPREEPGMGRLSHDEKVGRQLRGFYAAPARVEDRPTTGYRIDDCRKQPPFIEPAHAPEPDVYRRVSVSAELCEILWRRPRAVRDAPGPADLPRGGPVLRLGHQMSRDAIQNWISSPHRAAFGLTRNLAARLIQARAEVSPQLVCSPRLVPE